MLDTKSLERAVLPYACVDQDQVKSLMEMRENTMAGYIVYLHEINHIVFYDVLTLSKLKPRQSLGPQDGLILGQLGYMCDLHLLKTLPIAP